MALTAADGLITTFHKWKRSLFYVFFSQNIDEIMTGSWESGTIAEMNIKCLKKRQTDKFLIL